MLLFGNPYPQNFYKTSSSSTRVFCENHLKTIGDDEVMIGIKKFPDLEITKPARLLHPSIDMDCKILSIFFTHPITKSKYLYYPQSL